MAMWHLCEKYRTPIRALTSLKKNPDNNSGTSFRKYNSKKGSDLSDKWRTIIMIPVLYVDDESALLDITKHYLERSGEFRVDTATSANEAISKLMEQERL